MIRSPLAAPAFAPCWTCPFRRRRQADRRPCRCLRQYCGLRARRREDRFSNLAAALATRGRRARSDAGCAHHARQSCLLPGPRPYRTKGQGRAAYQFSGDIAGRMERLPAIWRRRLQWRAHHRPRSSPAHPRQAVAACAGLCHLRDGFGTPDQTGQNRRRSRAQRRSLPEFRSCLLQARARRRRGVDDPAPMGADLTSSTSWDRPRAGARRSRWRSAIERFRWYFFARVPVINWAGLQRAGLRSGLA